MMLSDAFVKTVALIAYLSLIPAPLLAADLEAQTKMLTLIGDVAERLCASPSMSGTGQTTELSASAKADVAKALHGLADLGADGKLQYGTSEYQGMLQHDLVAALRETDRCKLEVFRVLLSKLDDHPARAPALPPEHRDSAPTASTAASPIRQIVVHGVRYELVKCAAGSSFTCDLRITSEAQDRRFHIDPKDSFFIDDHGIQYGGTESAIGRKRSERWQDLESILVTDTPVAATVMFDTSGANISRAALVSLSVSSPSVGDHHVELRDIDVRN